MTNKLQLSVFRIDRDSSSVSKLSDVEGLLRAGGLKSQQLGKAKMGDFRMKLYYRRQSYTPKWKGVLTQVAKSGEEVLHSSRTSTESFVLLFEHISSKNIYAVTGGLGYFAIQDGIDQSFGIDIVARLINRDERLIKGTRETSVVGTVTGSAKQYRRDSSLRDSDAFGTIFREVDATLDVGDLVKHFGFSAGEAKKGSVCYAKSAFRLSKAVELAQLVKIISGCEKIVATLPPITINSMIKIPKGKQLGLVAELESKLDEQLWKRFSQGPTYDIDFDVCHREVEKYLTAASHVVRKGASAKVLFRFDRFDNIDLLFDAIHEKGETFASVSEFASYFRSLRVVAYGEDEETVMTSAPLAKHLLGDVVHPQEGRFFCIDGSWYRITADFEKDLNEECRVFVQGSAYPGLSRKWDTQKLTENAYSGQYIGDPDTIVLDKITPENIEPCDILKWDTGRLYLIHLKKGFNNQMRDLCAQVSVAANRILHERATGRFDYVGAVWDSLNAGGKSSSTYLKQASSQCHTYGRQQFLGLFEKRLVFVVAVLDESQRPLSSPERFRSNIAKFSLQELRREIRGKDAELLVAEVKA